MYKKEKKNSIILSFLSQYINSYLIVFIFNIFFCLFGATYVRFLIETIATCGWEKFSYTDILILIMMSSMAFLVVQNITMLFLLTKRIIKQRYKVRRERCQERRGRLRLFTDGHWYKMRSYSNNRKVEPGTQCDIVIITNEKNEEIWDMVTNPDPIDITEEYYTPDP